MRKTLKDKADEDGYIEVVRVARISLSFLYMTYKNLVEDVFETPIYYESYQEAIMEYARWAKAAVCRQAVRERFAKDGKDDFGHDAALSQTRNTTAQLREHAEKLFKELPAPAAAVPESRATVSEQMEDTGSVVVSRHEKVREPPISAQEVDDLLEESIRENRALIHTALIDFIMKKNQNVDVSEEVRHSFTDALRTVITEVDAGGSLTPILKIAVEDSMVAKKVRSGTLVFQPVRKIFDAVRLGAVIRSLVHRGDTDVLGYAYYNLSIHSIGDAQRHTNIDDRLLAMFIERARVRDYAAATPDDLLSVSIPLASLSDGTFPMPTFLEVFMTYLEVMAHARKRYAKMALTQSCTDDAGTMECAERALAKFGHKYAHRENMRVVAQHDVLSTQSEQEDTFDPRAVRAFCAAAEQLRCARLDIKECMCFMLGTTAQMIEAWFETIAQTAEVMLDKDDRGEI